MTEPYYQDDWVNEHETLGGRLADLRAECGQLARARNPLVRWLARRRLREIKTLEARIAERIDAAVTEWLEDEP